MRDETICVHEDEYEYGSITSPLHFSSTFLLNDEKYEKMMEGRARDDFIYSRLSNPTIKSLERKFAMLEKAEDALAFSSGMSAIATTFLSFLEPGDELITSMDLYGGTYKFIESELKKLGIKVKYVECTSLKEIKEAISEKTKMIFFETITNPLLKVIDVPAIAELAEEKEIIFCADETFATPINQQAIKQGADIVIHSASKYLGGHSDLIGGIVASNKQNIEKIWQRMIKYGGCMSPFQAYMLLRSIKTLHIRIAKHNENAMKIAEFLEEKGIRTIYPGLQSHEQYEIAKRLLKGYGGMVSFVLEKDEYGLNFMRKLKIIKEASSLGGVESLISMPFNTSHSYLSSEERKEMGIEDGFIRLSVGIENVEDLINDIENALRQAMF